jgi:hypothetical protein
MPPQFPVRHRTVRGLLRARKRWVKGQYYDGHGAYCLAGAIDAVYRLPEQREAAVRKVTIAIKKYAWRTFRWTPGLTEFNDHQDTKHADIVRVVRAAKV